MALIKCPKCKRIVSDESKVCPKCGGVIRGGNNISLDNTRNHHLIKDWVTCQLSDINGLLGSIERAKTNKTPKVYPITFFEDAITCSLTKQDYSSVLLSPRLDRLLNEYQETYFYIKAESIKTISIEVFENKTAKAIYNLKDNDKLIITVRHEFIKDLFYFSSLMGRQILGRLIHNDNHKDLKKYFESFEFSPGMYVMCDECGSFIKEKSIFCGFCNHIIDKDHFDDELIKPLEKKAKKKIEPKERAVKEIEDKPKLDPNGYDLNNFILVGNEQEIFDCKNFRAEYGELLVSNFYLTENRLCFALEKEKCVINIRIEDIGKVEYFKYDFTRYLEIRGAFPGSILIRSNSSKEEFFKFARILSDLVNKTFLGDCSYYDRFNRKELALKPGVIAKNKNVKLARLKSPKNIEEYDRLRFGEVLHFVVWDYPGPFRITRGIVKGGVKLTGHLVKKIFKK